MKLMTKLLMINWHYIKYQVMDFSQINFLTGKNGSGKSTIIDALQLVLLGDTSGYYFNKAANDKSQRSLKGYLRGEVAEDEETNSVYLRNDDFSSYLVLEFHDQRSNQSFCLGVVFDSYDDGSHDHQFFYLNDQLPEQNFIEKGTELNRKGLKAFMVNNYPKGKYEFFETNSKYQEVALGKLGQINKKFYRLLKKAVPFSPIMDIKGFIGEFVCDVESKIDINDMQENIRYYKQLEQDLEQVKKKIELLKAVHSHYTSYREEGQRLKVQQYLIDRGMEEQRQHEINQVLAEIKILEKKIGDTKLALDTKDGELAKLNQDRDTLLEQKINSDVFKRSKELSAHIDTLNKEQESIESCRQALERLVQTTYYTWREVYQWGRESLMDMPLLEQQLELLAKIADGDHGLITQDSLLSIRKGIQEYLNKINDVYGEKKRDLDELKQELTTLGQEIANLQQGIKSFPSTIIDLRQLIGDRLSKEHNMEIKPQIFADLLELKGEKWRNAIEGYLNTQKFYLLIEPKYFVQALKIYEEFKFTHKIYDVGLVDIGKIMTRNPKAQPGSLAEEVEATDPYARAYVDYLLGHVIKCQRVEDLRQHKTAITASCMLYHNYVARQINPQRYQTPYIGQSAIVAQLEIKEQRYRKVTEKSSELETVVIKLSQLRNVSNINEENIGSILQNKTALDRLPQVKEDLNRATQELGALDLSYLTKIEEVLQETDNNINIVIKQMRKLENSHGEFISNNQHQEDILPQILRDKESKREHIALSYTAEWLEQVGEPRFLQELSQRKEPGSIVATFITTVKGTQSRLENKWTTMVNARLDYNRDYNGALDVHAPDNGAYDKQLKTLVETLLVEYEAKIKDAKAKAQEQFKEDFISKLKKNIDDAHEQIDDLNKALKDVPFGRDKYRFKVIPNTLYKKYYDMITDDMLLEGVTLFSASFQSKYQDVVEELFRQIIDVDDGLISADRREELNKNLEKFTDYRTYLDFDLIVTDDRGMESRLSRVIAKKSGGETQTPFYISVLASFVQLYRVKSRNQDNTVRIIVFDEAYSKMDHQRIKESINLIRKLGLQVILSAPTEKIGDIAPLVDRNLCVTRIKSETIIKTFDPREIDEMGA